MTAFDWTALSAARNARPDATPGTINHALRFLEDLLEETDHVCTFTLTDGPLLGDVSTAVDALLPTSCRASRLAPVSSWSTLVDAALPGLFLPGHPAYVWAERMPARQLAESVAGWVLALLRRIWPGSVESWELTVDTSHWYEAVYVDLVVRVDERVWLHTSGSATDGTGPRCPAATRGAE
ncbi:hypothetical protein ABZU25_26000 [Micromonospora sp. NPDC005215]|uniref:hypothetical protein n=1 Tax=Micromonospora sp. NPDC005215 TaxID=3157024 RepID=UPI0033A23DF2